MYLAVTVGVLVTTKARCIKLRSRSTLP